MLETRIIFGHTERKVLFIIIEKKLYIRILPVKDQTFFKINEHWHIETHCMESSVFDTLDLVSGTT